MIRTALHEYSEQQFEAWLKEGFDAYLWEGAGAWAFPGAEAEIAREGGPPEGIAKASAGLGASQRGRLRRGLADALASLAPGARNLPIFAELLHLAVRLRAVEILRVLPLQIGAGFFGHPEAAMEDRQGLFGDAMLAVAGLSAPRADAVECLHALIGSPNFRHDPAYAGIALQALARAAPDALVGHFDLLRGALKRMFDAYQTGEEAKRAMASAVLDAVQLPAVLAAWPRLKYLDRDDPHAPLDDWFVHALLAGPQAPLVCEQDEDDRLRAFRREVPDVRLQIPEAGDGFLGLLDLLRDRRLISGTWHWGSGIPMTINTGSSVDCLVDQELCRQAESFGLPPEMLVAEVPAYRRASARAP
jgi:hypothetical protein